MNSYLRKTTILLIFSLLSSDYSLAAQETAAECGDSIAFKSGSSVKAKIIETTANEVVYKRCANINGPAISASKSSISLIKYTNGTTESFKNYKKSKGFSDSASIKHRYFGLGIRAGGLTLVDLLSTSVPPFRIIANIDPVKYVRLEVQYGLYKNTTEQMGTTSTSTITLNPIQKSSILSFGFMGMYPAGNARLIAGLRYGINNYSTDQIYYPSGWPQPNPYLVTNTGKRTMFSGVLGGEYFFVKYFSVGAEFSILSIKNIETQAGVYNTPPTTSKTLMSEGCLMFRFYPL